MNVTRLCRAELEVRTERLGERVVAVRSSRGGDSFVIVVVLAEFKGVVVAAVTWQDLAGFKGVAGVSVSRLVLAGLKGVVGVAVKGFKGVLGGDAQRTQGAVGGGFKSSECWSGRRMNRTGLTRCRLPDWSFEQCNE